ncbi:hypothetical protein ACWDKQ_32475 [Saccharopolyspora sp. NPDC000995]
MSTMDCDTVLLTQDGPVLTVTINRPRRKNAIDGRRCLRYTMR